MTKPRTAGPASAPNPRAVYKIPMVPPRSATPRYSPGSPPGERRLLPGYGVDEPETGIEGGGSEGGEQYAGYLSGILSDRMSGLCRYFVGPYVGIASGLCRYCVGAMSGVMSDYCAPHTALSSSSSMSDYTGVMSGPRASQGGVMCLRKGHLDLDPA